MHSFERLDGQMRRWASKLRDDVKVATQDADHLATKVFEDVSALDAEPLLDRIGVKRVSLRHRLDELVAFQAWMDLAGTLQDRPEITRAQVITQNYVCFVYLGEALFKTLYQQAPHGSTTRKCCKFLTNNPVRALRNALAHGNWTYTADFCGLVFWARKGEQEDEPLTRFTVLQHDLGFWQALARSTAYAAFLALDERDEAAGGSSRAPI